MKVCIVAIAKNENLYINEGINYHLNIGFDHIYICDNNNKEEISNSNSSVTILDYRCKSNIQKTAYTDCFRCYKDEYDGIMFIDIDEFVMLDDKYQDNIKNFISDSMFADAKIIRLHGKVFSGGTELEANGNYSVVSRFTERFPCKEELFAKSIIKTDIEYKGGPVYGHGYFENRKVIVLNAIGQPAENVGSRGGLIPIHENAGINHYPTKTIGEFIDQKYFRGGANLNDFRYKTLDYFFKYNPTNEELKQYGEDKIKRHSV